MARGGSVGKHKGVAAGGVAAEHAREMPKLMVTKPCGRFPDKYLHKEHDKMSEEEAARVVADARATAAAEDERNMRRTVDPDVLQRWLEYKNRKAWKSACFFKIQWFTATSRWTSRTTGLSACGGWLDEQRSKLEPKAIFEIPDRWDMREGQLLVDVTNEDELGHRVQNVSLFKRYLESVHRVYWRPAPPNLSSVIAPPSGDDYNVFVHRLLHGICRSELDLTINYASAEGYFRPGLYFSRDPSFAVKCGHHEGSATGKNDTASERHVYVDVLTPQPNDVADHGADDDVAATAVSAVSRHGGDEGEGSGRVAAGEESEGTSGGAEGPGGRMTASAAGGTVFYIPFAYIIYFDDDAVDVEEEVDESEDAKEEVVAPVVGEGE
ncbi:hypothetical protein PTSG_02840 [Salpingoeca rosetta]|uniref:Uncharacterized protein n=1 Tax=Salpingoeca rosetta (strain ATCC 50818 / BSB-021) TaxID=946362 RepID=F2U3H3_SALR5|nr:uncharacterized protein PTSG_02840 [Salpingoeca rosetta]EGD82167.1 hypothetical protein PTSG_02840 [Salpingoeca rosetta]|eukprot:XP_004996350.1 hypothetical protein PTSG_02840 [Salpingoeca rosetta]